MSPIWIILLVLLIFGAFCGGAYGWGPGYYGGGGLVVLLLILLVFFR